MIIRSEIEEKTHDLLTLNDCRYKKRIGPLKLQSK
jgi:hypothetical protein